MPDVHLVSFEQAAYLDVAMQTRRPDEQLPPCPVCHQSPQEVRSWGEPMVTPVGMRVLFVDCSHIIAVDPNTWGDWCEQVDTNPMVEIFEEHKHQQQLRARRDR